MGIGPEQSTTHANHALARSIGFVLLIAGAVYAWDPEKHAKWVLSILSRPQKIIRSMVYG
jgi:hypothetical protein